MCGELWGVVPVAERIFLPLRQRRQLWGCDEDGVLAALRLIRLYQPGVLRPVPVHLHQQTTAKLNRPVTQEPTAM